MNKRNYYDEKSNEKYATRHAWHVAAFTLMLAALIMTGVVCSL